MKKSKLVLLFAVVISLLAFPALAAEAGADGGGDASSLAKAAAALGLGIAAAGGAMGQGRAAADALAGIARNPGASGRIQTALLLSLAFMESLVIFAWVMVLMVK
jgi:F-type H+-transporting ATPase subunit c